MKNLILYFVLPFILGIIISQSAVWMLFRLDEIHKQKDEIAALSDKLKKCEKSNKDLAEELKNEKTVNEGFSKILLDIGKGR